MTGPDSTFGINGGWGNADYDHSFNTVGHYNLAVGDYPQTTARAVEYPRADIWATTGRPVSGSSALKAPSMKTWLNSAVPQSPFFPATDTWQSKLDWMATVTGRVGYAWNNVMGYVKGGWAYAPTATMCRTRTDFVDASGKKSGWTLGGGHGIRPRRRTGSSASNTTITTSARSTSTSRASVLPAAALSRNRPQSRSDGTDRSGPPHLQVWRLGQGAGDGEILIAPGNC